MHSQFQSKNLQRFAVPMLQRAIQELQRYNQLDLKDALLERLYQSHTIEEEGGVEAKYKACLDMQKKSNPMAVRQSA